jgi:Protein of unknown function (DUF4232)
MKSRTIPIAIILITGMLVSACSSGSNQAGSGQSAPASSVAAASTATDTPETGSAPASSVAAASTSSAATETRASSSAGLSACTGAQLATSVVDNGPGAGQHLYFLVFKNTSSSPCLLSGYPGAAGLNAAGQQAAQAQRDAGAPPAKVAIAVGQSASATLETSGLNSNGSACSSFAGLLVTPPNTSSTARFANKVPTCNFKVTSVKSGSGG